ncbi:hypothetical protein O181_014146 [Austropuccinia psidii MF-1]|uniref:Uncharacterized protein n=1 Tax=Austropuccinia psidii MF-1 TaxID=1389203 RepID=A0A9Q3GNW3_9BASI|nr:hypothetical protein [Austropuccinia psidii MF-1]
MYRRRIGVCPAPTSHKFERLLFAGLHPVVPSSSKQLSIDIQSSSKHSGCVDRVANLQLAARLNSEVFFPLSASPKNFPNVSRQLSVRKKNSRIDSRSKPISLDDLRIAIAKKSESGCRVIILKGHNSRARAESVAVDQPDFGSRQLGAAGFLKNLKPNYPSIYRIWLHIHGEEHPWRDNQKPWLQYQIRAPLWASFRGFGPKRIKLAFSLIVPLDSLRSAGTDPQRLAHRR